MPRRAFRGAVAICTCAGFAFRFKNCRLFPSRASHAAEPCFRFFDCLSQRRVIFDAKSRRFFSIQLLLIDAHAKNFIDVISSPHIDAHYLGRTTLYFHNTAIDGHFGMRI